MLNRRPNSSKSTDAPVSISYVVRNGLCVGCGVCEAACPNEAIKVVCNSRSGMPNPTIRKESCNSCRTCLRVCYGYEVNGNLNTRIFGRYPTSIIGNFLECYLGRANDEKLRQCASSGGVVTALLIYALERKLIDGAIVTRMEAGNFPISKAFIATSAKEILSAQGSKYCPVSLGDCLKNIEKGKRLAVVGLPCHLYGIRRLSEFDSVARNSIALYVGILCGGMPNYLGTQYIMRNYRIENRYITRFEYRGGGWPGRLLIQSKKPGSNLQSKICVPYPHYWRDTFRFFFPYRCTLCHDGFNEFSDISLGDAWLPNLMNEEKGTSLIITRTKLGDRLILDATQDGAIQASRTGMQDVLRSQLGLIKIKSSALRARTNLCRAFRLRLPMFDSSRIPPASFESYLSGIGLYLGNVMASKRTLWSLLDIYTSSNMLLNIVRNYSTRIRNQLSKQI